MNHRFLPLFAAAVSAALFVTACGSKKDDPSTPTTPTTTATGTVNGQITPANAIASVTATDSLNRVTSATPLATGAYTFALPATRYTLRFAPAAGYTAPADQNIRVYAKGTTTPDPTKVTQSGGTATLTVGGTATPVSLVRADYSFGDLTLTVLGTTGQTVQLRVSPYGQTAVSGTFAGVSNARLSYTETAGGAQWASPATGNPTGTYTVTPAGTNPVRISGTFSCTLTAGSGGATGTRMLAGTFTNVAL